MVTNSIIKILPYQRHLLRLFAAEQQQQQQSPNSNQRLLNSHRRGFAASCEDDKPKGAMLKLWKSKQMPTAKITIVGAGMVGSTCALACLAKKVASKICLVDVNTKRATAEKRDLSHASIFLNNPIITTCTTGESTKNSRIIVITVGKRPIPGKQSRLDLVKGNADLFKTLIPKLVKGSPNAILLVASNPVDVMTYVTSKISGFPRGRVIGSGCHLDTARFRYYIARRLKVAPTAVNGFVIGEHGTSAVPVWSSVNVGGTILRTLNKEIGTENDPECWSDVTKKIKTIAAEVNRGKGYTNWAIGFTLADIISAIVQNRNRVICLSIDTKGFQHMKDEIYLSLPCVVGGNGVKAVLNLQLSKFEKKQLMDSAKILKAAQDGTKM